MDRMETERDSTIVHPQVDEVAALIAAGASLLPDLPGQLLGNIDLRRIEAAREIATKLGGSRNKVYLDSDSLLLNLHDK